MLICEGFQLINRFSEWNDTSQNEIITIEFSNVVALRLALATDGRDETGCRNGKNSKP